MSARRKRLMPKARAPGGRGPALYTYSSIRTAYHIGHVLPPHPFPLPQEEGAPHPVARKIQMRVTGIPRSIRRPGSYKSEIGSGKAAKVGKDGREVPCVHPEPGSQRGEVLIASRAGNPAAGAVASTGVVRTAEGEGG